MSYEIFFYYKYIYLDTSGRTETPNKKSFKWESIE